MSVVERVRRDREDLARVLKNYPGIRRIVEDLYPDTAHFIYELLQNAEDTQASKASFVLSGDALVFEHNGRPFDEDDIRGITNIGEGTKASDDDKNDDKIGRFGIGFKAVLLYTETPRIWSPTYAFEIAEMVLPSELPPKSTFGGRTRFEFPFNSGKKPRNVAFTEVRDGLDEISANTLLFLSHIEEIEWRIEDRGEGRLLRIGHSYHHIEILREIDDRATESSHFLRFTEPVEGLELQYAAIAFELEPLAENGATDARLSFAEQFRIAPADRGCVAVYFTAAKETSNLRFHLHAPFVPELSRSSIKDTPANKPLFQQLARLSARSLSTIRDLGLLDRDFLAVLPNSKDQIPAQYAPIRHAIVDEMNERPLTPMHAGGHAPANRLLQAEAGLKALLAPDDIRFLIDGDKEPRNWAIAATQRNSHVDHFLRDLKIKQWGVEQFAKTFENRFSSRGGYYRRQGPDRPFLDWMRSKSDKWHCALYALFHRELKAKLSRFRDVCIARRSDGEYGTGSECYFPTPETREDPIHHRLAEDTFVGGGSKAECKDARAFLEGIGVREVGEREQIEAILIRRYGKDSDPAPSWETHESDLRLFIALAEKDSSAKSLFEKRFIFQRADGQWSRPGDLYLDTPYPATGLQTYYGPSESESARAALSDSYRTFDMLTQLVRFARMCGVADRLEIASVSCAENPKREHLYSAHGSNTYTGIDADFTIPELKTLFKTPTLALSRLVWKTLCDRSSDKRILKATFRRNRSNDPRHADSQLVHQLRNAAWIPQGDVEFVHPADARRDLLPYGFPFDPGWRWLDAIRFGAETGKFHISHEMAKELGFRDEDALADGIQLAKQLAKLPLETRQRILKEIKEHEEPVDLPTREPGNLQRRAESVREKALNAPERTTEKRARSVSVNRDAVKGEQTDPYLRDLYTNADGVTICQICKDRLPFMLADGSYFFESVEFLPDLERYHYQNYLALCPNHAAMFRHANGSKDEMRGKFLALDGNELEMTLADQPVTVYFTESHVADLRVVVKVENARGSDLSPY